MEEEKSKNVIRNGGGEIIKLPIGYRFHPTDEELIIHYLRRKIFSIPLPASVIPDWDVLRSHPSDLPGDVNEKRYFFSKRKEEDVKKCRRISGTGCGFWKVIGRDKVVVDPSTKQAVGLKKSLAFYQAKSKTPWFMHEYRLVGPPIYLHLSENCMMQMDDWVVCRIYKKKSKAKNRGVKTGNMEAIRPFIMDFMMEKSSDLGPPQPTSSSTSSENELEQESCSNVYTNFPSYASTREQ